MEFLDFKVWNIKNKKMMDLTALIKDSERGFSKVSIDGVNNIELKRDYHLLQYSELRDKNDRKMFDRDIIRITNKYKSSDNVRVFMICYIDFCWRLVDKAFNYLGTLYEIANDDTYEIEYLGNWYEDSDLLR